MSRTWKKMKAASVMTTALGTKVVAMQMRSLKMISWTLAYHQGDRPSGKRLTLLKTADFRRSTEEEWIRPKALRTVEVWLRPITVTVKRNRFSTPLDQEQKIWQLTFGPGTNGVTMALYLLAKPL